MHSIFSRPGRLLRYLLSAVPFAAILAALLAGSGGLPAVAAGALAVPMTLLYAFLALPVFYPCRAMPLESGRWTRIVSTHATAALLLNGLWVLVGAGLARVLALSRPLGPLAELYGAQVPLLLATGLLFYIVAGAVQYTLIAFEANRSRERRESEVVLLEREAELQSLKARIQPHFLFNSLNAVSGLIGSDPERAREMCVGLADFLRKSLAAGERSSIPIADELMLARHYLDVERIRFGNRLRIEERIEESGDCHVPPLLLQPLVENAVVHGIATLVEGGTVRLEARRAGNRLRIVVENPFDPEAPRRARSGLGLRIVRERLEATYGSEAIFAARRLDGRHLAIISLPAHPEAA